jgi:hypothetical protein
MPFTWFTRYGDLYERFTISGNTKCSCDFSNVGLCCRRDLNRQEIGTTLFSSRMRSGKVTSEINKSIKIEKRSLSFSQTMTGK